MENQNLENYKIWIKDAWIEAGGLVSQKTASLISGLSEAQISRRIKEQKMKIWIHPKMKKPFVSYREAMIIKRKRKRIN